MALKGSTDILFPARQHEHDAIEISHIGPTVYDSMDNNETIAQNYDSLDVVKDLSETVVDEGCNGLSNLAGTPEGNDGSQSCTTIVLGTIGMFLLSTLVSIGTGIVVYQINNCSNEDTISPTLNGENNTCTNDTWPESVDTLINNQLSRLNDEWNKRMDTTNNKHSESLERLMDINNKLLQLVNASQSSQSHQTTPPPVTGTCCPEGWLSSDTSCYLFVRNHKSSYTSAENYCHQRHNSHIVEVETQAENVFLKDYMRGLKAAHHWLGLTDLREEGVWRWHNSGIITSYTNWRAGQPGSNGGEEDCTAFWWRGNYEWADVPCTLKLNPVCEVRKTPRTVPDG